MEYIIYSRVKFLLGSCFHVCVQFFIVVFRLYQEQKSLARLIADIAPVHSSLTLLCKLLRQSTGTQNNPLLFLLLSPQRLQGTRTFFGYMRTPDSTLDMGDLISTLVVSEKPAILHTWQWKQTNHVTSSTKPLLHGTIYYMLSNIKTIEYLLLQIVHNSFRYRSILKYNIKRQSNQNHYTAMHYNTIPKTLCYTIFWPKYVAYNSQTVDDSHYNIINRGIKYIDEKNMIICKYITFEDLCFTFVKTTMRTTSDETSTQPDFRRDLNSDKEFVVLRNEDNLFQSVHSAIEPVMRKVRLHYKPIYYC